MTYVSADLKASITTHLGAINAALAVAEIIASPAPPHVPVTVPSSGILWGAWVDGSSIGSGYGTSPWDMNTQAAFESHAAKQASIIHYGQFWYEGNGDAQPFNVGIAENVRGTNALSLLDWNPWDSANAGSTDQPTFRLSAIASGAHDAYITDWAHGVRDWGHPVMVRLMHEMNGNWFPWCEQANGNAPGQFISAWRRIVDVVRAAGAGNVDFVWCPNVSYGGSTDLAALYPGDAYVDWVGLDGYNWGGGSWTTFSNVFAPTYTQIRSLAPSKPVMIAETASAESGGSKATWITDAITRARGSTFSAVKAFCWFNWDTDATWRIESSTAARNAFASGIANVAYRASV